MNRLRNKTALLSFLLFTAFALTSSFTIAAPRDNEIDLSSNPVIITTNSSSYFLQVGIFSIEKNVENLKNTLHQNGMPVMIEPFETKRGDILRKILVGPFYSGSDAERELDRVREITGLDPLIVKRGAELEMPEKEGPLATEIPDIEQQTAEKTAATVEEIETAIIEEAIIEKPLVVEENEPVLAGTKKPKTIEKSEPKTSVEPEPVAPEKPASRAEEKKEIAEAPTKKPVEKRKPKAAKKPDAMVSLDFTDVDISVLIKFISEVTGKNFIYDEKVRGNITIISPKKITQEEMYQVFLSVLQVKGFTTVEQGNVVKIIPTRDAVQEGLKTFKKRSYRTTDEFITQLIPLKYIDAKDASPLLTPLISKEGLLTFYSPSNTLIIIDRGSNISRIADILAELDIDTAAQVIKLYQLEHAPSDDVTNILNQLYTSTGRPIAPRTAAQRARQKQAKVVTSTAAGESKFLSDPRTNSVIILAPSELIEEIEEMIAKLDIPAPENVGKINVYYLENADAEELATVLNNLISGTTAAGRQPPQPGTPSTIKGIITPEFEGPIKLSADKSTNSLLVIASPVDYLTLVDVIKKLDIKRRQVYVEAIIMEVQLDKGLDLGAEYRGAFEPTDSSAAILGSNFNFSGNVNDLLVALAAGNPLLLAGEGLTAGVIGGTVILPDGTEIPAITAILRAAQVSSNTNVLATPHLLTTDNEEAEIIVGENVPFITSQARDTTNLANIINTVEREDVGTTLRIIPQIHESDFVKLDIYQETSAIKEGTSILDINPVGPTTTKRSAKTNVIVKSGQTIILGGLMQERRTKRISKIPLLGDIPLLGALFRFESTNAQKTNLLIFLTPKIIKDIEELQGVTLKMKESMKMFIEKNVEDTDSIDAEEYNKVLDPYTISTE
jgi:general secretion pathway protein D